ncbi:hypothetical protein ACSLOE_30820, partial [Escherichia coli]|uniref:hypothetical protein n=1 Tax=Escherichia coli TaxID=562 RepID=UPI003EE2FF86
NDLNKLLEKDILHYPRVRMANDNFPEIRGYKGFIRYTYSQTGKIHYLLFFVFLNVYLQLELLVYDFYPWYGKLYP